MRKNFNAQKYNKRMDKIFEKCRILVKKRERIDLIKKVIRDFDNWELEELRQFIDHVIAHNKGEIHHENKNN